MLTIKIYLSVYLTDFKIQAGSLYSVVANVLYCSSQVQTPVTLLCLLLD